MAPLKITRLKRNFVNSYKNIQLTNIRNYQNPELQKPGITKIIHSFLQISKTQGDVVRALSQHTILMLYTGMRTDVRATFEQEQWDA